MQLSYHASCKIFLTWSGNYKLSCSRKFALLILRTLKTMIISYDVFQHITVLRDHFSLSFWRQTNSSVRFKRSHRSAGSGNFNPVISLVIRSCKFQDFHELVGRMYIFLLSSVRVRSLNKIEEQHYIIRCIQRLRCSQTLYWFGCSTKERIESFVLNSTTTTTETFS